MTLTCGQQIFLERWHREKITSERICNVRKDKIAALSGLWSYFAVPLSSNTLVSVLSSVKRLLSRDFSLH